MRSIRGKGKLSFGHALLTSVKSMQSRHLPFAFLISTTLANHSGYSTSDYSCLEEFANLLVDLFLPFWREAPPLLFDWLEGWADVQPLCDYCGVNSSHVCLLPRKDIFILSQKMGERDFEVLY